MSKSNATKADEIIDKYILWSMGAGAIPLPLLDIAALTTVQLNMLKELSDLYGKEYSETFGRTLISSLAGSTLTKIAASLIKFIPGVGSMLGAVPMVVLSGASTYAMGQVFKKQLQVDGVTSMFSYDYAKKVYDDAFETGKGYVTSLQEQLGWTEEEQSVEDSPKRENVNQEVIDKLKMLDQLKEQGILNEEEHKTKKEKLINELMK